MRALRVQRHGEPAESLAVEEVPAPVPGPEQVLVRVPAELMDLVATGRVRPLVARPVGLDGGAGALEARRDREVVGRLLVRPG